MKQTIIILIAILIGAVAIIGSNLVLDGISNGSIKQEFKNNGWILLLAITVVIGAGIMIIGTYFLCL